MGEKMTFQVRVQLLKALFHKQISWFDRESAAPGVITTITSEKVVQLNGMTTEFLATLAETALMMVVSILAGFLICWQQAIIAFILSPIVVGGAIMSMKITWKKKQGGEQQQYSGASSEDEDKSEAILSDVIMNYKTVISFGQKSID